MKLIIILGNQAYETQLKEILKASDVKVFSADKIEGFHFNGVKNLSDNWFGTGNSGENSVMLFAFSSKDKIEEVFKGIEKFNENDLTSKVHAFMLNVEAAV